MQRSWDAALAQKPLHQRGWAAVEWSGPAARLDALRGQEQSASQQHSAATRVARWAQWCAAHPGTHYRGNDRTPFEYDANVIADWFD
jgi:hypothetical protein